MNKLSIFQIAEFASASVSGGDGNVSIDKISTDSRTLKRGELFVALRGENFDGHQFVEAAAKSGALGAIVDLGWECADASPRRPVGVAHRSYHAKLPNEFAIIRAEDTLRAFH